MTKIIRNNRVYGGIPTNLGDIQNVDITSPTNNQALVYDSTTNKWKNDNVSAVGSLNDLTDVTISSVQNKQELVYNSTSTVFENKTTRIELTQAQYDALTNPEADVDYYITDAPSMNGTSADLSYDGTTKSVYTKIGEMDTTISDKADTSSLATVATSGSYNDLINKPTRTNVKSQVTFNEDISGTNTQFYLKSGCLYIFYQGESKSHSANDVLFTLPTSLKPTGTVYCPCVVNSGAFGDIEISSTGSTKINQLSATASGRVYFHCVIPLE